MISSFVRFVALCLVAGNVVAAKVSLTPDNWGLPAGEECVNCHSKSSSGLTAQWKGSAHAEAGVNCLDCHQASTEDADAITHEGHVIATVVSPKDCGRCHTREEKEQRGSVHAEAVAVIKERMPAMVTNLAGPAIEAAGCAQCHGSVVKLLGNGKLDPNTWPNSGIGRVNPDGSRGSCSSCHGRHEFSKAQAREPQACVRCHSGPDSPDKEVYEASKHGMAFATHRDKMNLNAETWVAGKDYSAAPTCATCHMGAAGKLPSTHDVGMRNAWNLNTPVSERQHLIVFEDGGKRELPASMDAPRRGHKVPKMDGSMGKVKMVATPERRRQAMTMVCRECHGKDFANAFMDQFDGVVDLYNNKFAVPARSIMQALYAEQKLTPTPFDEPIEFTYWELWHDEGARARHGASMMSPNHAWWEGIYVVSRNFYSRFLPQVREVAGDSADALIEKHVTSRDPHRWMSKPNASSPILGVGSRQVGDD
ncbi:MAG: ammonia-forming cytochrome c nitrite reductase subunit c552 [Gammaproteobacteria bacterium]|nr:ammonia-forming cytochrome c nitrite reductase subunit c552 [Gammaproteobacteria bacterium]